MSVTADYVARVRNDLGDSWLPHIYRQRILKMRTRAYELPPPPKRVTVAVHHTLLGIELKVGSHRRLCPDLATARYLAVFARAGCTRVAIPYDITRISLAADELESSWHRMLLLADEVGKDRSGAFRTRVRSRLIGKVREEIDAAGGGARIPSFKQSTRQRHERSAVTNTASEDS